MDEIYFNNLQNLYFEVAISAARLVRYAVSFKDTLVPGLDLHQGQELPLDPRTFFSGRLVFGTNGAVYLLATTAYPFTTGHGQEVIFQRGFVLADRINSYPGAD
jgi:hypothetical protein